jgi:TPR repeat protein
MCRLYQNGEYGLEQDERKALEFCLMAAEAGDPWSEYQTSLFYRSGIAFGMTFTKSLTKFLHWLRLSADHGCMFAQFDLGYILKLGKILPQDLNATHRLYTLAASQGLVSAIHHLGLRAHHLGEQNTCVYWLCKAADLGHVESITSLAACLAENPFHIRSRFDSFDPLPGYSSLPLTLRLLQRIPMNDAKHIFVKEFIMPKLNTWKRICAGCGRQMTRSDLRACSQW